MDISVIILNYRGRKLVAEQLKFFYAQTPRSSCEVIVVDNASNDGIGEYIQKHFPQTRFIQSPDNRGYAAGNNIGIKEARGTYVIIANPDIVLTADLVDGLYAWMEEHPRAGIAGPRILNADGTLQESCARFPSLLLPIMRRMFLDRTPWGKRWHQWYFMRDWDHTSPKAVDWLFGACVIVRMSALQKVGLLDEDFFLYLEDTDWCRRFWEQGYEVWYVPQASATHLHHRSSEGTPLALFFNRSSRIHSMSFIRYIWKYRGKKNPHVDND